MQSELSEAFISFHRYLVNQPPLFGPVLRKVSPDMTFDPCGS